jgi:magnesium transporter
VLKVHLRNCTAAAQAWQEGKPIDEEAVWLDLIDPSEPEVQIAHAFSGLRIPRRDELTGLTLSSRIGKDADTLYLSVPYFAANHDDQPASPLGLVLAPHVMITVRFAQSRAFELCEEGAQPGDFASSGDVFAALFESIVDLAAERMEGVAGDLRKLSERVFSTQRMGTPILRRCMLEVGRLESIQTRTRTSLLSVQRIIVFVRGTEPSYIDDHEQTRLRIIDHDLRTLDEFDDQLTNKLQFLLDASLGFINTDQNHVMKVLTVVSVATVPPVILAGIWGMNFKHMPELDWTFGYPLALGVILVSMIVPVLWFRSRGWLAGD